MQCEQQLASDGVVLLENVLSQAFIDSFSAEYAKFDATLSGEEKTKDPLVVFWKHVEGEQKRTVSLKKCSVLESFILNDLVKILTSQFPKIGRLQLLECIIFNKPDDPARAGYTVQTFEMQPTDLLVHDGYTWHQSGPNVEEGHTRKGVSIRFITSEATFDPRPGQGAAFTK